MTVPALTESPPGSRCHACGQPQPARLAVCACGHLVLGHDLDSRGQRTACLWFGPAGRCACRRAVLAAALEGHPHD
jgi:hypothetical protein